MSTIQWAHETTRRDTASMGSAEASVFRLDDGTYRWVIRVFDGLTMKEWAIGYAFSQSMATVEAESALRRAAAGTGSLRPSLGLHLAA